MKKLNIKRFVGDPFAWDTYGVKNVKRDGSGNLTQVEVYANLWTRGYSIDTIYEIDANGNTSWATDSWTIEEEANSKTTIHKIYSSDTSNIKGIELHNWSHNYTATLYFHFTVIDSDNKTTYLTKTSATAVLKGNVLNSLNTYDWNNAPSVAAVRNYFESGSAVQSQKEWLKNLILETTHPVGSLEINTSGINPSEYLGGEWESFGSGRTLVGVDSNDSDFNTAEETGGEKTHTLTTNEIPGHNHMGRIYSHNYNTGKTIPQARAFANSFNLNGSVNGSWGYSNAGDVTNSEIVNTIESDYTGGNGTHNNLQPYITVYFWKRVS